MIVVFLLSGKIYSEQVTLTYIDSCGQIVKTENVEFNIGGSAQKPNPVIVLLQKKFTRTKRLTAAVLAFPFPFGIVGLHRIYLGTKPYVPVAYIASLGGIFGILPLIDFFAIIFDNDFSHFENNGKVFMWIRD